MNENLLNKNKEYKEGMISLLLCMLLWGLLPVYWKALIPIDSWIIILYRISLAFLVSVVFARTRYSWKEIFAPLLEDKKLAGKFFAAGLIITINWSTYIWAVNSGHMIQSSIGYYIEPLVVCLLAIIIFKERLSKFKVIAFALATLAIVIQLVHYKEIPGIALGLASSFAIYAAIKKTVNQPALISMVYETFFLAPIAFVLILYLELSGKGALSMMQASYQLPLLLLSGVITVIPLVLFGSAAMKVPMVTLGLMEYISPTIGMLLGIFVYHEPIDIVLLISLVIIWIGLGFFTVSEIKDSKPKAKPIIGVHALVDDKKDSYWMLPGYFEGIIEAGAIPVMMPLIDDEADIERLVDRFDGFLFTGGHDVGPEIYGMTDETGNVTPCKARDDMEIVLLKKAMEADKPIFGICRGLQFINATLGGTLYQDIPMQFQTEINHRQPAPYDEPSHKVELQEGSWLRALSGEDSIMVNSCHHQGIKDLAEGLIIAAKAKDGLVEAIEMPGKRYLKAVQWHPEFLHKKDELSRRIFKDFVDHTY